MKQLSIFKYLLCAVLFAACGKDPDTAIPARGFLEYSYSYFLDGEVDAAGNPVFHYAYKRIAVNQAFFVVRAPESAIPDKRRFVDLYIQSDHFTGMNTSSLGGAYAKIQLMDTLALDADQNRLLPATYNLGDATSTRPVHLGFEGYMNLQQNGDVFSFEDQISGSDPVYLLHIDDNQYEIVVNGIWNDRTYNFHYAGPIRMENDK